MPTPADESRILRARQRAAAAAVDRLPTDRPRGVPRYLGRVTTHLYSPPATVPAVFLTNPLSLDAPETEGSPPTLTADTSAIVPVLVLGPAAPSVGTDLIARQVSGRWVAMCAGAAAPPPPPTFPCSPCNIPEGTLYLTWTYANLSGGTSTTTLTLNYTSSPSPAWTTPAFQQPDYFYDVINATMPWHIFSVQCFIGSVVLIHQRGPTSSAGSFADRHPLANSTYSCSPFSGDWSSAQIVADLNTQYGGLLTSANDKRFILTD
jgi:hypothetical protein